jgi:hypothetical protein
MKNIVNWEKLGLRLNPFGIKPEKESKDLIWAGLNETKRKFDALVAESLRSDDTKVILHMTRWGGGKTHTSFYYSNPKNFPEVDFNYTPPLNLLIVTPKEGNIAPNEFYTKIVENIGINYISESIKTMRDDFETDFESLNKIRKICNSEDIGRILWLLGDQDPDISYDASSLFFSKPTAVLKRKLRVRRGIESTTDKFVVLSTLFKILSLFDGERKLSTPRRIFLWMDEIESLIYYSTRYYKVFSQAIRELIDMTPRHLTLFMNFSFADEESISTLGFIIGKALSDRITEKIIFYELTIDDALEYVSDLLSFFRTDDFDKRKKFHPFDRKALENLFEYLVNKLNEPLMPRTINKWCLKTINQAFEEGYFGKNGILDENFIAQLSSFEEANFEF